VSSPQLGESRAVAEATDSRAATSGTLTTFSIRIKVVSRLADRPLLNATVYYGSVPTARLEDVVDSPPVGRTDVDGGCVLPERGCYLFVAEGHAPKAEWIDEVDLPGPVVVRLDELCYPRVRLTEFGRPKAGFSAVVTTRRWTAGEMPKSATEISLADAGRIAFAVSDSEGLLNFGVTACRELFLSIDTGDYAFKDPQSARIAGSGAQVQEVAILPLFVGSVPLRNFPEGWSYRSKVEFPSDVYDWSILKRGVPIECWPGRRAAIMKRLESEHLEASDADRAGLVNVPITAYAVSQAGDVSQASLSVSIGDHPWKHVSATLLRPSAWRPSGDGVDLADDLPRDLRRIVFNPASSEAVTLPTSGKLVLAISGKNIAGGGVALQTTLDASIGSAIAMIPDGTYTVKPVTNWTTDWRTPAVFKPKEFTVGAAHASEILLPLDRSIALVALNVKDGFGRAVQGFTLFHKRAGIQIARAGASIIIDDDFIEYQIVGVKDAQFVEIPKTKVPLLRGAVHQLDVILKEKDE